MTPFGDICHWRERNPDAFVRETIYVAPVISPGHDPSTDAATVAEQRAYISAARNGGPSWELHLDVPAQAQ